MEVEGPVPSASSAQGQCQPDTPPTPEAQGPVPVAPHLVPQGGRLHGAQPWWPQGPPEELAEGLVVGQRVVVGLGEQVVHVVQAPLSHELPRGLGLLQTPGPEMESKVGVLLTCPIPGAPPRRPGESWGDHVCNLQLNKSSSHPKLKIS